MSVPCLFGLDVNHEQGCKNLVWILLLHDGMYLLLIMLRHTG